MSVRRSSDGTPTAGRYRRRLCARLHCQQRSDQFPYTPAPPRAERNQLHGKCGGFAAAASMRSPLIRQRRQHATNLHRLPMPLLAERRRRRLPGVRCCRQSRRWSCRGGRRVFGRGALLGKRKELVNRQCRPKPRVFVGAARAAASWAPAKARLPHYRWRRGRTVAADLAVERSSLAQKCPVPGARRCRPG
jgi:hypothetical protein